MKYRLYIDEVGDPGLKAAKDPRYRYLSLTGIIMELDYVNKNVFHELESLKKKYFHSHVDDPVILHRKELVNKRHPFQALRDENVKDAFDKNLLQLLNSLDYKVITLEERSLKFLKRKNIIAVRMEELTGGGENASLRQKKRPRGASKAIVGLPPPLKRIT